MLPTLVKNGEDMSSMMVESVVVDIVVGNDHVAKIKQPKTVILDKSNYHAWRVQFIGNLKGNHLIGYVEGTIPLNDPLSIQQD